MVQYCSALAECQVQTLGYLIAATAKDAKDAKGTPAVSRY
jgi:hypothetical protein